MDFYINELKRYSIDIISDNDSPIFDDIVESDFFRKIKQHEKIVFFYWVKKGLLKI